MGLTRYLTAVYAVSMTSAELIMRCNELLSGADRLARDTQRLIRWRAWVVSLSAILAGVLAVLLADVVLRREEQGLRILASIGTLGLIIGVYLRVVRPARRLKVSRLQIARWVSHSKVEVPPKLVEALQLAELIASEATPPAGVAAAERVSRESFGSDGFQHAAMTGWLEENRPPAWESFINRSAWWRQLGILGCVCVVFFGAFVSAPPRVSHALGRLLNPVGRLPWPLADDLQLVDPPAVIALGESVQLEVVDLRPPLPGQVDLLVREVERSSLTSTKRVTATLLDDMAIANLRSLKTAIEVCPVGGEHVTRRWHRIDVVQPPRIVDYAFEIAPPSYSQLPKRRISGERISVLAGSSVVLKGMFETPLDSITGAFEFDTDVIKSDRQPAQSEDWRTAWCAVLGKDGLSFSVGDSRGSAIQVRASMRWQLILITRDGLRVRLPDVWSVEAKPDLQPQVVVQRSRVAAVTSGGKIAVKGSASDDYGLRRVELVVIVGDKPSDRPEYRIEIEEYDEETVQRRSEFRREFELAELFGAQVEVVEELTGFLVSVEVTDTLGQVTRGSEQPFEVKSPTEIIAAVGVEQTLIAQQLSDIVRLQRENQTRGNRAVSQLSSDDDLEQADASAIEVVARTQAEVGRQLGDPQIGLTQRITAATDSLSRNGLAGDQLFQQLNQLANEVRDLSIREARDATDLASQAAAVAAKNVAENRSASGFLMQKLSAVVESGQNLLSRLEGLQDRVAREQSVQQLASDLQNVLQQQRVLQDEAEAVQLQSLDANDESYRLRLGQLAGDQALLADELDALMQRVSSLAGATDDDVSAASGGQVGEAFSSLQQAAEEIAQAATGSAMRRASDRFRDENFADASNEQSDAADSLAKALSQAGLAQQGNASSLQQMAEQTRTQTRLIRELAEAQRALAESFANRNSSAGVTLTLSDQQQSLMRNTRIAKDVAETNDEASLVDQLGDVIDLQQIAASVEQGERAVAATASKQAADQLDRIVQRLDERSEELAGELRKQQAFDLQARLVELADRQREIVDEIRAAADASNPGFESDPTSLAITRSLLAQQQEVETMVRDVEQLPTFTWALNRVASLLDLGKAASERGRLRPDAEDASVQAMQLLEHALSAISQPERNTGDDLSAGDPSPGQPAQSGGPAYSMASLRLLRALQLDLRQQLSDLSNLPDSRRRSRLRAALAGQQEALVELLETMQK